MVGTDQSLPVESEVYSDDVSRDPRFDDFQKSFNKKITDLTDRMDGLATAYERLAGKLDHIVVPLPRRRSRKASAALIVAIIVAVITAAAWIQPQFSSHRDNDLNAQIDSRIDTKLGQPQKRLEEHSQQLSDPGHTRRTSKGY
jgi:hypothetical protein